MSNAYKPTRQEAREYLDLLCPWDLEDRIDAIDPDRTMDPWDLDEALVSQALSYLTLYYQKQVLRPDSN